MPKDSTGDKSLEDWYRLQIDKLMERQEALDLALIQINASLIQLCARIAENSRPNETQLLMTLIPYLTKQEPEDPKVTVQLQRIAETLKDKEPKKPNA